MSMPSRRAVPIALLAGFVTTVLLAPAVGAQTTQTFTPKSIVQFAQGGDRERATLARVPALAPLVQGQFGIGAADFNDDGQNEIVILSLACDEAGCPVVVMQNAGGQPALIFAQKMNGRLAITNEKINGYNAIAAADPAGAIMNDASGQQLVYPLGGNAAAVSAAPAPAPAVAAPAPVAPAAPAPATAQAPAQPPQPAPAPTPAAAAARPAPAQAASEPLFGLPGHEYIPVCTAPSCLSPRVNSKSGIGTENAVIEGVVTLEDATAWCAIHKPRYRLCAEEEFGNSGSAGPARFVNNVFRITANCEAGTLEAVDKRSYTLVGTWPEDGPGAGRPRFQGSMSEHGGRQFIQPNLGGLRQGSTSTFQMAREPNSGESLAIQWEMLCPAA